MSCKLAISLANSPKNKLNLDPVTILGILSSLFSMWKICNPNQKPTAEMLQQKLATKWNDRQERYHPPFLRRVAHDVQEASEHNGTEGVHVESYVHEEFSNELLNAVRLGDPESVTEALKQIT